MKLLEKVKIDYPEAANIRKAKKRMKEKYGDDIEFTIEKETRTESQQEWSWREDSSYTTTNTYTTTWLLCEKE